MHGVRREYDVDIAVLKARQEEDQRETEKWHQSLHSLTVSIQTFSTDKSSLDALLTSTAAVLLQNPDYYVAWNWRKRAILADLSAVDAAVELGFNVQTIKKNPKSYFSWYHRKWFINQLRSKEDFDPSHELKLCFKLLDLDARNFHCWNYRKWLLDTFPAKVSIHSEFDFTGQKIFQNFSNYSAWHRRAHLLHQVFSDPAEALKILHADLNLVRNAYYTEPADQSAWFYLSWLCGQLSVDIVDSEISSIRELLVLEPTASMALLTIYKLSCKTGQDHTLHYLLDKLINADPLRTGYYRWLRSSLH